MSVVAGAVILTVVGALAGIGTGYDIHDAYRRRSTGR